MWRLCCCNCQVDETNQCESGHVKATTNKIDDMSFQCTCTICSYVHNLLAVIKNVKHPCAVVFKIPSSKVYKKFDVIVSFSLGVTKGLRDSATTKVEPHDDVPPIDVPILSLDDLIKNY
jgi:pto-interacting protein 1